MSSRQNAHLTYKGNDGAGRHAWLRLTPAYSVRLVREQVAALGRGSWVTDPFSGTGTTVLAAAEHGLTGQALDINPFLIWLGQAKVRHYDQAALRQSRAMIGVASADARSALAGRADLWQPPLANIDRWWPPSELRALMALRASLDELPSGPERDLLDIAFCRALISASNAAFNHQSMSFKAASGPPGRSFDMAAAVRVVEAFRREAEEILASAGTDLPGDGVLVQSDARSLDAQGLVPCDLLLTSPPYANRMSYVRELRPYMYWLRFLGTPAEASDLDWTAIGGTWGTATSRLTTWHSSDRTPIDGPLSTVCGLVARDGGTNGPLLATYVRRYFTDMWTHAQAAYKHVRGGGRAVYVIGNSTFYGHVVPAEQWYRTLLLEAGFGPVDVTVLRKRNSKKELFEFAVTADKP